jgi:P-type Cu+ transporter
MGVDAMTTDPVCGMKIDEKSAQAQTQYAGRNYSFCSEECKKEFEEHPEQYAHTAAA